MRGRIFAAVTALPLMIALAAPLPGTALTAASQSPAAARAARTPGWTSAPEQAATARRLLAVGDIPTCGMHPNARAVLTANLAGSLRTGTTRLAGLGDENNGPGTYAAFVRCYEPWKKYLGITYPVPGNHEYNVKNAAGYFRYFGQRAHPPAGWYSYDFGTWHIVALNSECGPPHPIAGGCGAKSPEYKWLAKNLAAFRKTHPHRCILAYWHIPVFTSGHYASKGMVPMFRLLYQFRTAVVLNGHDHQYERFAPQTPGQKLSHDGIREFVVGTGGAGFHPFTHPYARHSQKRIADKLGVLELTLSAGSYQWAFWQINQSGKKVTYSKGDSSTTRFPCPKYP